MNTSSWARGVLAIAFLFSGAAAAPPAKPGAPASVPKPLDVPDGGLVAAGKAPELELLYTGDVIGYLEDCGCKLNPAGGLAKRAWLVNQLKTNYPQTPLVLLDSGNFADNPSEIGDLRTAALLDFMAKLGYKVVNVGERDLTLGYDDFIQRTKDLKMDFISTNIVKQGSKSTVFPPYAIVEVKGTSGKPVKIGVMGVIRYSPVWQKAGPAGDNLGVAGPEEMVQLVLSEVRAKSDIVVLLAAVSKEDAHDIAKSAPQIDFILGSYGGIYNTLEESEGPVRILYTGNQGKRIGESRIDLDAKRRVADVTSYMHFLTARFPDDKAMAAAVADAKAKIGGPAAADAKPAEALKPIGATPAPGGH
ncbi:MAG TPA: hypothetical protein VFV19_02790 [Candidatus Polarisedimenticolaceae bacterium]|nr:hypothetical protein [Candidatus Polarisedimenticolaceae bacterium]